MAGTSLAVLNEVHSIFSVSFGKDSVRADVLSTCSSAILFIADGYIP